MSFTGGKSYDHFLNGFESALDLYPKIELPERFESTATGFSVDAIAIENDWKKIGQDLEKAIKKYENSSERNIDS